MLVDLSMTRHSPAKAASTTVPVHPLVAERWSPRGFDRGHELGDRERDRAAGGGPLGAVIAEQPAVAVPGHPAAGEEAHGRLFATLAPGNQAWAGAASALVLVAARTVA